MPNRVSWEPGYAVGHADVDAQHRDLLDRCNALADLCPPAGADRDRQFDQAFEQLKAQARAHFATEAALLASLDASAAEDHRIECDEFEYLADEIATTENFDRLELQRFLALWFVGHVAGSAGRLRELGLGRADPASPA